MTPSFFFNLKDLYLDTDPETGVWNSSLTRRKSVLDFVRTLHANVVRTPYGRREDVTTCARYNVHVKIYGILGMLSGDPTVPYLFNAFQALRHRRLV